MDSERRPPTRAEQAPGTWHRLHIASPLINLVPQAWRVLRSYWPLLIAVLVGSEAGFVWLDLIFLPLFFLAPMVRTVVHWATLSYRIHDGRLEIRSGLLNRQARLIGPERIQNSELVRNPLHRLTGLVEVRLETAGGEETEGLLSALDEPRALWLLGQLEALRLEQAPAPSPAERSPQQRPLLQLGVAELVAHGLTARRVGVLAILLVVGLELWQQLGGQGQSLPDTTIHPGFMLGIVLASFVLGVLLAVANSLVRFHDFRLEAGSERVAAQYGLITRRKVQLRRQRIQLLRVDEPLFRRWMGYATLHLETAGLAAGPDGVRQAEATIPMVDRDQLARLCAELLQGLDADPWGGDLQPAPLRALGWNQQRALVRSFLLVALTVAIAGPWGLLALVVWPLLALAGWFDWRWQAWRITDQLVLARRGFWIRRTWILPRRKVQSAHCLQSPLLRIWGLAQVLVRMAGNRVWLPPLETLDATGCLAGATTQRVADDTERDTMPLSAPAAVAKARVSPEDEPDSAGGTG